VKEVVNGVVDEGVTLFAKGVSEVVRWDHKVVSVRSEVWSFDSLFCFCFQRLCVVVSRAQEVVAVRSCARRGSWCQEFNARCGHAWSGSEFVLR
jgi:hypothetical protein